MENDNYDERDYDEYDPALNSPKQEPPVEVGEKKEDWVKVSERLPEHNVGVLVFIPEEDHHITSGMWDISNKWVLLDEYRTPEVEVTHWRSLPDIPIDFHKDREDNKAVINFLRENLPSMFKTPVQQEAEGQIPEDVVKAANHYAEVMYGDSRKYTCYAEKEGFDNCVESFAAGYSRAQSALAEATKRGTYYRDELDKANAALAEQQKKATAAMNTYRDELAKLKGERDAARDVVNRLIKVIGEVG